MVNYVKFIRGSVESWNKLTTKDSNTLYFIYEDQNADNGVLYLGDKIISGGAVEFQELNGININNLHDGDLLIYNENTQTWETKAPVRAIPIMTGATAQTNGTAGLTPVPQAGSQNLFLRGDGSWQDPVPQILKKKVDDLVALDAEKSAREIAAEESAKATSSLQAITNSLNNRISQLEQSTGDYITNTVFINKVGNLNQLFDTWAESNTVIDAINELDYRLKWQKLI